ncbi:MAG: energy transducer TonB [Pseudomonadota bacterium]
MTPDAVDAYRLVAPPVPDRLPAMLFLAALIHGVLILGLGFNPALSEQFTEAISLEVTIVADPDQRIDRPDRAEYLAQTSQLGGGNTSEELRPSAPQQSISPIDNLGKQDGDSLLDSALHEQAADQLLATRNDRTSAVADNPRNEPQPDSSTAIALERGAETTLPLPQEQHATLKIHDDEPRQLIISADTSEASIAAYLDNWKRRIEVVGAEYFPQLGALEGLSGSPTLEVSIDADGQLAEVIIRKSSGSVVLDKAALDILRRASPFDPFPAEIRADYDNVRFAYKWLFAEQNMPRTASLPPPAVQKR